LKTAELKVQNKRFLVESLVEKDVVSCGKVVFSGPKSDLLQELNYLQTNYKRERFYIIEGKPLFTTYNGIVFFKPFKNRQLETILHKIMQMGIHAQLKQFVQRDRYFKRRHVTKLIDGSETQASPQSLTMKESIQTLFYLKALFAALSIIVFSFERVSEVIRFYFIRFRRKIKVYTLIYKTICFNHSS